MPSSAADSYLLRWLYYKAKMGPYPNNQEFGLSAKDASLARKRGETLLFNIEYNAKRPYMLAQQEEQRKAAQEAA